LALVQRLAMYVEGNLKALAVVRVPTPKQDLARSESRFRDQLSKHRLMMEAQGRSLLLYHGVRVRGRWWQPMSWAQLQPQLPPELIAILEVMRRLLLAVNDEAVVASRALQKAAKPQPVGVGGLSSQTLEREILDWNRFTNRRQVASLTGLCPGVRQSGNRSRHGSITRHGNRRIRTTLIEMAWRCRMFQPDYPPVRQRVGVLNNRKAAPGAKKKAIVAVARHLAVDLWRINTGRCTAQERGLR
jgi:transposase